MMKFKHQKITRFVGILSHSPKPGDVTMENSCLTECREEQGHVIMRRWFNSLSGWVKDVSNGKGSSGWKTGSPNLIIDSDSRSPG